VNEREAAHALDGMLVALGVDQGRTVMLHIDMAGVPLPDYPAELSRAAMTAREQRWFACVHDAIRARLGPEGTLIVPTFTYSCSEPGSVFDVDATPSEVGRFTEWFRTERAEHRSSHPLFSLAGAGLHAVALLDVDGGDAFGPSSPFGRFADDDVRIVSLGLRFHEPVTYVHHLEHCSGSPHRFHKVIDARVVRGGQVVDRQWVAFVRRNRDGVFNRIEPLEDALRRDGLLATAEWNGRESGAADVRDVDRVGYAMLATDPLAFTSESSARSPH